MNDNELLNKNLMKKGVYYRSNNVISVADGYDDNGIYKKYDDIYAKQLTSNIDTSKVSYYILCANNQFFDPEEDKYDVRYKRRTWKFVKVGAEAFNLYLRYMGYSNQDNTVNKSVRRKSLLIQAERLL